MDNIKCECGQTMTEVGNTGAIIQIVGFNNKGVMDITGERSEVLYQCLKCKLIKIV